MNKHITAEAIAAFKAADYMALHRALGLTPWNSSPLPIEIEGLGVDQDEPPEYMDAAQRADWRRAQQLQQELLKACGWPDFRRAYEENLREAEEWLEYCQEQVDHPENPPHGGVSCELSARRRKLEEVEAKVAYRKRLLAELDDE